MSALSRRWTSRSARRPNDRGGQPVRPEDAHIAVTAGLLDTVSREELQAVVAHEMGHVVNYDVRLMTLLTALVGMVALVKIGGSNVKPTAIPKSSAQLCIADPFHSVWGDREGKLADLMATHPPLRERVERLRQMAYQNAGSYDPPPGTVESRDIPPPNVSVPTISCSSASASASARGVAL